MVAFKQIVSPVFHIWGHSPCSSVMASGLGSSWPSAAPGLPHVVNLDVMRAGEIERAKAGAVNQHEVMSIALKWKGKT